MGPRGLAIAGPSVRLPFADNGHHVAAAREFFGPRDWIGRNGVQPPRVRRSSPRRVQGGCRSVLGRLWQHQAPSVGGASSGGGLPRTGVVHASGTRRPRPTGAGRGGRDGSGASRWPRAPQQLSAARRGKGLASRAGARRWAFGQPRRRFPPPRRCARERGDQDARADVLVPPTSDRWAVLDPAGGGWMLPAHARGARGAATGVRRPVHRGRPGWPCWPPPGDPRAATSHPRVAGPACRCWSRPPTAAPPVRPAGHDRGAPARSLGTAGSSCSSAPCSPTGRPTRPASSLEAGIEVPDLREEDAGCSVARGVRRPAAAAHLRLPDAAGYWLMR